MSFRLFVYYSAMCGGLAAWCGWALVRVAMTDYHINLAGLAEFDKQVGHAGFTGLLLGLFVGFGLGIVDALANMRWTQIHWIALRGLVAAMAGAGGGLAGAMIGDRLYRHFNSPALVVPGWMLVGILIGIGVGVSDIVARLLRREQLGGALRKLINSVIGGALGGLVGGLLYLGGLELGGRFFPEKAIQFWTPLSFGFVAVGLFIGLLIGLTQVILKEAWIRVESGFRSGRELILSKEQLKIGRAENCEIPLFGDPAVEKLHTRLVRRGGQYYVEDAGTAGGTFVNGQRIHAPTPLRNGDAIGLGRCVLRFGERRRRAAAAAAGS